MTLSNIFLTVFFFLFRRPKHSSVWWNSDLEAPNSLVLASINRMPCLWRTICNIVSIYCLLLSIFCWLSVLYWVFLYGFLCLASIVYLWYFSHVLDRFSYFNGEQRTCMFTASRLDLKIQVQTILVFDFVVHSTETWPASIFVISLPCLWSLNHILKFISVYDCVYLVFFNYFQRLKLHLCHWKKTVRIFCCS